RVDAELLQHGGDRAAALLEQRGEQVLGAQLLVGAIAPDALRPLEGFTGFDGKASEIHFASPPRRSLRKVAQRFRRAWPVRGHGGPRDVKRGGDFRTPCFERPPDRAASAA